MFIYFVKRMMLAVAAGFTLSIITFTLLHSATDPARALAGDDATEAQIEQIRVQYHLDRSLIIQYADWLGSVAKGDFGESWYWRQPVAQLVSEHLPVTIQLALMAVCWTIVIAIPLGILAALNPNSWIDRLALSFAVSAHAIPSFWLGLILIVVFSLKLQWLPVSGDQSLRYFIMPSFVLGVSSVPAIMRLTRTGLLESLASDYVRTARAKGVPESRIVMVHALRNSILPVVAVLAVQLGSKLGGSVVTESVFAINGVGRLALQSILAADLPTVQMLVFSFAIIFITMNLLADLINAWLDPRIRLG